MIVRPSALACLACLAAPLGACGSSTTSVPVAAPAAAAAPTNTSIASARALRAGEAVDLVLPCTGKVYFGAFQFTAEGQQLALATTVRSPTGTQACGGGAFVDGADAQQAAAGVGCVEAQQDYAARLEYGYTPGAGGSDANPLYLALWTLDGAGGPVGEGCAPVAVRVAAVEVP